MAGDQNPPNKKKMGNPWSNHGGQVGNDECFFSVVLADVSSMVTVHGSSHDLVVNSWECLPIALAGWVENGGAPSFACKRKKATSSSWKHVTCSTCNFVSEHVSTVQRTTRLNIRGLGVSRFSSVFFYKFVETAK